MSTLEWLLSGIGTVATGLILTVIGLSIAGVSSFYPLGEKNWQFYVFWGTDMVHNLVLLGVASLQFGALGLPRWLSVLGGGLFVGGFVIVVVATADLGVDQTQGMEGELRTDGLYRYSRNPQYVGYMLSTVGFPLLVGAPFVVPLCGLLVVRWLILPLAEEPWLRDQFGEEYAAYMNEVPRFVGLRTVRQMWNAVATDTSTIN
jgi:protein-S-isoprenylcysteine O-methyltransferase Ste14